MDETNAPVFSFVLPAHNELPNLEPMTDRLRAVDLARKKRPRSRHD